MSKVVVTTSYSGVFFGELVEKNGDTVTLANCRNCIHWPESVRGFMGLASLGPLEGSRVSPASPRTELYGVTSISQCTDDAVKQWESERWS
jgi:hypothetical protein